MEWTDEIISRLQTLWQEGLSTAEIGRQLSITKNAVVGKAHRLGLPPRPSPIRASAKPRKEAGTDVPATPTDVAETPAIEPIVATPVAESPVKPAPVEATVKAAPKSVPAEEVARAAVAPVVDEPSTADKPQPARKAAETKTMSPDLMLRPLLRPLTGDTSPRRGPSCCWPHGDPGTPNFHFCGAKPVPGKPYCAEHCAIAYVKLRDRRESVG